MEEELTPLQNACIESPEVDSDEEVLRLIQSGCDVLETIPAYRLTPLEIIGFVGRSSLIEPLWRVLNNPPHSTDVRNEQVCRALCHSFSGYHTYEEMKHKECIDTFLKKIEEFQIDTEKYKDRSNHTALFYAKCYRFPEFESKLLKRANLMANYDGVLTLDKIDPKTLKECFDKSIDVILDSIRPDNDQITFNYETVCPVRETEEIQRETQGTITETKGIFELSNRKHFEELLVHPLIGCFVFMKWQIVKRYFWIWFILRIVYLIVLFVIIFIWKPGPKILAFSVCGIEIAIISFITYRKFSIKPLVSLENVLNIAKFWILQTWPQILTAVLILISYFVNYNKTFEKFITLMPIIILSFNIFFQARNVTLYAEVFYRVFLNYFKLIMLCIALLLSFSAFYFVIFNDTDETENLTFQTHFTQSFYYVFTLLVGNISDSSSFNSLPLAAIPFIFIISIVFANILNADAVSEILDLKKKAEIVSQKEKIHFIYAMEILHFEMNRSLIFQKINPFILPKKISIFSDTKILKGLINMKSERSEYINMNNDLIGLNECTQVRISSCFIKLP